MPMGSRLSILLLVVTLTCAAAAQAADAEEECPAGRSCFALAVPLDRTGDVPGSVKLWVERIPAEQATRPPLFLIPMGPGNSATWLFDDVWIERVLGSVRRSRDIVLLDQRGTGRSDPLLCPALQAASSSDWSPADVSDCAASLEPRQAFHTVGDMAADIDAVRSALGADEIALFGDTSGASVALEYARRHPDRVERLLLQSPRSLGPYDPLHRGSLQAAARILSDLCAAGRCEAATPDIVGDVRALVERLERQPLTGTAIDNLGRPFAAEMDGYGFLNLLAKAEVTRFVFAELPAAVHSALRGDPLPLLRSHHRLHDTQRWPKPVRETSLAAYLAMRCAQAELPWTSTTPLAARRASAEWLVEGLPPYVFGPFGAATAVRGVIEHCAHWPVAATAPDPRPLPAVPTLVLAGERSVVGPVEVAREVAAALPGAHLLAVPDAGHHVLHLNVADCEREVVDRFLASEEPAHDRPWECPGDGFDVRPVAPVPRWLEELPVADDEGDADQAERTLAAVLRTIQDGFASLYLEAWRVELNGLSPDEVHSGGLRGGAYVLGPTTPDADRWVRLEQASLVEGVSVTGSMSPYGWDLARSSGRFTVSGAVAAPGRLTLRGGVLSGRLGDRKVSGALEMPFVEVVGLEARR